VTRLVVLSAVGLLICAGPCAASASDRNQQAALAFVSHRCAPSSTRDATLWVSGWVFNPLFGDCSGGDGHDQHVWFFAGKRFVGRDAPTSSAEIIGLWRDSNVTAFLYVLYRPSDALCCPTGGGRVVRFRVTATRVVRLDPLPRRSAIATQPGRYP
jgi:LppP/LprE lipoprotein